VNITQAEFLGLTKAQSQDKLTQKGLRMDAVDGDVAPTSGQVGTAYKVNPVGPVAKNDLIAVTFYSKIPAPPTATVPAAVTYPAGPHLAGSTVTVAWAAYTGCPSGFPLSRFSFQVQGGTIVNPGSGTTVSPDGRSASVSATATTLDIKLTAAPGVTTISYTAICTSFESPLSPATTITAT
jgi:serine/threonine-protein kinase